MYTNEQEKIACPTTFPMERNENINSIVARLGTEDPREADAAGRQLLEKGTSIVGILLKILKTASQAVRRRLVYVLGEIGRTSAPQRTMIEHDLQSCLHDPDWKVRRNTAVSLGKVGGVRSAETILERLSQETEVRVRTSLILAFGELAPISLYDKFKEIAFATEEERNAADKVLDRFRAKTGSGPTIDTAAQLSSLVAVELWCRAGVSGVVASEANKSHLRAEAIATDRVVVYPTVTLDQLMLIRTALFPVLVFTSGAEQMVHPRSLGEQFAASPVASEVKRLTKGSSFYRVTTKIPASPWRQRRDWISEFAEGCQHLVNSATGYAWELIIRRMKQQVVIGARPAASPDMRFIYRKTQLPASLHPTLAAAAVRLVPPALSDIVLDPFCGSGTLLAERALLAPYKCLIGLDISLKALHMAQENLQAFAGVELLNADVSAAPIRGPVHIIVTNPPYGSRVLDLPRARQLHAALDDVAAATLYPGGYLIVFRPPSFPVPRSLKLIERRRIDAGGISVNLMVAQKLN